MQKFFETLHIPYTRNNQVALGVLAAVLYVALSLVVYRAYVQPMVFPSAQPIYMGPVTPDAQKLVDAAQVVNSSMVASQEQNPAVFSNIGLFSATLESLMENKLGYDKPSQEVEDLGYTELYTYVFNQGEASIAMVAKGGFCISFTPSALNPPSSANLVPGGLGTPGTCSGGV